MSDATDLHRVDVDRLLPAGLAAIAALALYLPALSGGFLSDDYSLLHAFYGASTRDVAARVMKMFVSGVGPPSNQYRPLTMASFAVNAMISGANPVGWRLVNVLLHAANAALVTLLAFQLAAGAARQVRWAALAAGITFAWFPTNVEAVAWIASRFDAMALLWMLIAACAFLQSRIWYDRWGVASLAATMLAFMSKESAGIGPLMIVALAWAKKGEGRGFVRDGARALVVAAPWMAIVVVYAAFRLWLFGDALRFFPGSSPGHTLVTGEWLRALLDIGDWWALAIPDTGPRRMFGAAGFALTLGAIAASVGNRALAHIVVAIAAIVLASFALMLSSHSAVWPSRGEGGRLLYPIAAVAALAIAAPLGAPARRLRIVAWIVTLMLLSSELVLARAAVERRARAGADMLALVAAIGRVSDSAPSGSFSFVVVPDHLGSIIFARNAQGGLMIPPVQSRSLASQLIVQTTWDLPRWPELLERDVVGSLKRGTPADISADPLTAPAYARPDRYFCWSLRTRSLIALDEDFGADLRSWNATWNKALDGNGCRD